MTYEEWERDVPAGMKQDVIWRVQAYRLAHYLAACAVIDTRPLIENPQFVEHVAQLCRAAASVTATIAEGYPRRSLKDRAKYYEYALTSLTEAKSWYMGVRSALAASTLDDRFAIIRSITRLLITMIRQCRRGRGPGER